MMAMSRLTGAGGAVAAAAATVGACAAAAGSPAGFAGKAGAGAALGPQAPSSATRPMAGRIPLASRDRIPAPVRRLRLVRVADHGAEYVSRRREYPSDAAASGRPATTVDASAPVGR